MSLVYDTATFHYTHTDSKDYEIPPSKIGEQPTAITFRIVRSLMSGADPSTLHEVCANLGISAFSIINKLKEDTEMYDNYLDLTISVYEHKISQAQTGLGSGIMSSADVSRQIAIYKAEIDSLKESRPIVIKLIRATRPVEVGKPNENAYS